MMGKVDLPHLSQLMDGLLKLFNAAGQQMSLWRTKVRLFMTVRRMWSNFLIASSQFLSIALGKYLWLFDGGLLVEAYTAMYCYRAVISEVAKTT